MKPLHRNFLLSFFFISLLLIFTQNSRDGKLFFPRVEGTSIAQGALQELLKKSQERIAKNPDDLKALVDSGVAYFFMGPEHYADSLNAFNSAWRSGAFDKRIFYYSGILYENLSLFTESQKQYERFLRHEPKDREIQLRLARLLFRMGQWDDSIRTYQRFIKENEKDVASLINLGLAFQKKYELKQQKKALPQTSSKGKKKSLADQSKPADHWELHQAIFYLEQAAKLQPALPKGIYLSLAVLYFEKGDWQSTGSACESELKASPNEKETLFLLSSAYEQMRQLDKSLEICAKLLESDPQNKSLKRKIKSLKSKLKK